MDRSRTAANAWAVFRGGALLAPAAASQAPAELLAFIEELNSGQATAPGECAYGIVDVDAASNTRCPRAGVMTPAARRGKWELSYLSLRAEAKLLGLLAGQQLAPTLASVLHRFYGTEPFESPEPVTSQNLRRKSLEKGAARRQRAAEKSQQQREQNRLEAINLIAVALERNAPPRELAEAIVEALHGVFQLE